MSSILIIFIKFYRLFVSPMIGPNCRFYPSCSGYAIEALHEHGTIKGIRLTMYRILKCHPFHLGGYDPVPREQKNCELRKTTDLE